MDRKLRDMIQQGHRRLARVNARDHNLEAHSEQSPEQGLMDDGPMQHPELNTQRFDGIDQPLNPEHLSPEARREYDNQRREQEMEKQHRLGNMPKFNTAPKPAGP